MVYRTTLVGALALVAIASGLGAVTAKDVVVQSSYCEAGLSLQQVTNAGITHIHEIRGDNLHRRYVGMMKWQGDTFEVGAEVHLFTCRLTNIVAPVTRDTPIYGAYVPSY